MRIVCKRQVANFKFPTRRRVELSFVAFLLGPLTWGTLSGCATTMPEAAGLRDAAVLSVQTSGTNVDGVQLIVFDIDGKRPEGFGPAPKTQGSSSSADEYGTGTVISQPPLTPRRTDFALAPGTRRIGLIFAVPGSALLNLAIVTRGRSSEATGIELDVVAGCQYTVAAKLTLASGRDYRPEVRAVNPAPARYGVAAAATCPTARDVRITLVRG